MRACKTCGVDISRRPNAAKYCESCSERSLKEAIQRYKTSAKGRVVRNKAARKYSRSEKGKAAIKRMQDKKIARGVNPFENLDLDTPTRFRDVGDVTISIDVSVDDLGIDRGDW